jgi:hypothetical protein
MPHKVNENAEHHGTIKTRNYVALGFQTFMYEPLESA